MAISKTKLPFLNFLTKGIENIISLTSVVSANTTLSNGQSATFTITTTSNSGNRTMTIHDFTLYIGSVAAGNQLPDGGNITMSQWVVVPFVNDWGGTDNIDTVTKVYVENVSAGSSQKVIIEAQARFIQNSTTLGGSS